MHVSVFLAQEAAPATRPTDSSGQMLMLAVMFGLVTFILLTGRSQRKREKRERNEMFERLSKNDRVLTIGGVIGTIVSVKDNEVVLKVDESTNTKMTFVRTAIQKIIAEDNTGQS